MYRKPVLQTVGPAGILRHISTDGADHLAGRIRCVVAASRRHGFGDFEVHDTRLDRDSPVRNIDVQNAIETRHHNEDTVGVGHRPPREAGPLAPSHERHTSVVTQTHDLLHFSRGARQHHQARRGAELCQAIRLVDGHLRAVLDNVLRPDHLFTRRDKGRVHGIPATAARAGQSLD